MLQERRLGARRLRHETRAAERKIEQLENEAVEHEQMATRKRKEIDEIRDDLEKRGKF